MGGAVVHFAFQGLEKFANWWFVIENGGCELCVANPAKRSTSAVATDLRTLTEIWAGDLSIADAKRAGRMVLRGEPVLTRSLPDWLRPGLFADVRPAAAG